MSATDVLLGRPAPLPLDRVLPAPAPAPALGPGPGAIKVIVLDAERLPAEVSAARARGGRYDALWALIRHAGRPTAMLKLPFVEDRLSAEELSAQISAPAAGRPGSALTGAPPSAPMISVIVPSMLARLEDLWRTLESLERLEYPAYEILLVDNRPPGEQLVPDWLTRFPAVRLLRERRPGISAARNCGLADARGKIVAFTDDDVTVDPGWLAAIAQRFARNLGEACVTGMVLPRELETPAQIRLEERHGGFGPRLLEPVSHRLQARRDERRPWVPTVVELNDAGAPLRTFSLYASGAFGTGVNMAFSAAALREVGGFDRALGKGTPARGGEDRSVFVRLAWRGHALGFEPAALVHHCRRPEESSLATQLEGAGVEFVAMLLALIADDRRHLGALLATVRTSVSDESRASLHEDRRALADLARLELRGMLRAPLSYLHSRRLASDRGLRWPVGSVPS